MDNTIKTVTLKNVISEAMSAATDSKGRINPLDAAYMTILNTKDCYANYILKKLLKEWELETMRSRLHKELDLANIKPTKAFSDNEYYDSLIARLVSISMNCCPECEIVLNTGHLLIHIIEHRGSNAYKMLQLYDIKPEPIVESLLNLPDDEDAFFREDSEDRIAGDEDNSRDTRADNTKRGNDNNADEDTGFIGIRKLSHKNSNINLRRYCINVTEQARNGSFDPVIGREKEIERLIQVLGRRKKNNPVLIGEAGVGKSAIVEGLAIQIVNGSVPASLLGKSIYSLDVATLIAGTKYRGEFEERMKDIIKELKEDPDAILFIDEIHMIVGAGGTQGSLDSSNILKPALARGEIKCIGTTTFNEYRDKIENDSALERRFQKITVNPPDAATTLEILRSVKKKYEEHHGVFYTEESLVGCVELSGRYISDHNYPDKALDVMDEAGSKAHSMVLNNSDEKKQLMEMMKIAHEKANYIDPEESMYEASKAYAVEQKIKRKLKELRDAKYNKEGHNRPTITNECIYQVVSDLTGIPVHKISSDEKKRLQDMEGYLNSIVIGQKEAVASISKSMMRSRVGLKDPERPIGVFMFVGPTGVGKTLLAKELAKWMYDGEESLIRLDMSEYSEKHNISRMIGSPPGYVGYGHGGQLTEAVRRQPYSVVLFDEIEKAHPDVYNIMLQIFDEGQLTDGSGRKVDFRDTIIIITSNIGTQAAVTSPPVGFNPVQESHVEDEKQKNYRKALDRHFHAEFLNRIDGIVVFNSLNADNIRQIADLEVDKLVKRSATMGYTVEFTEGARQYVAEKGYDKRYGARSLRRAVVNILEEPLAEYMILEDVQENSGEIVIVDCGDDNITFRIKETRRKN